MTEKEEKNTSDDKKKNKEYKSKSNIQEENDEANNKDKKVRRRNKRDLIILVVAVLAIGIVTYFVMFNNELNRVNYSTSDYIELGEYKNLKINYVEVVISDEDVDFEIAKALDENQIQVTQDVVEDGSTVNIDYSGSKDGVQFEGGTASNQTLIIGSGQFIPGFEEGLIGYRNGDRVVLELTFPDEYQSEELAGEDVEFEVVINSITAYEHPLLDDDFAKQMGYDTVEEYRASIKDSLEKEKIAEEKYNEQIRLMGVIMETSTIIEYPEEQVKYIEDEIVNEIKNEAEMQNMELENYISYALQMDMTQFDELVNEYAITAVRDELIIYGIAQAEGIEVTKEEYNSYIDSVLEEQGLDDESFKQFSNGKSFEEFYGEDSIYFSLYVEKVIDRVIELGKKEV